MYSPDIGEQKTSSNHSRLESNSKHIVLCVESSLRGQIEEGFRDLKSARFGLSFEHANCRKAERIEIFLLIAMLACLIAYITGIAAESENLHQQFQINTVKRRVLSYFFLGCRVIVKRIRIAQIAVIRALDWIRSHAEEIKYVSIP